MTPQPSDALLALRIAELVERHGSLRAVSRVLRCDHVYLWRLQNGQKNAPGAALLKKLGLRRSVTITYERTK